MLLKILESLQMQKYPNSKFNHSKYCILIIPILHEEREKNHFTAENKAKACVYKDQSLVKLPFKNSYFLIK